eukprot:Clim_evm37s11 gene=Clim_evmTU37s11
MSGTVEDDGLPRVPDLRIAQLVFLCRDDTCKGLDINKKQAKEDLLALIQQNEMAPFYEELGKEFGWEVKPEILTALKAVNQKKLDEFAEKLKDAEENLGDVDVRDLMQERAEYLCKIGDREAAEKAFSETLEKTSSTSKKLQIAFFKLRMGMFFGDQAYTEKLIDETKQTVEKGGDWDHRNRLKVYEGMFCMSVRRFDRAATCLLESLSTFTSSEVCSYQEFVFYAVLCGMIALDRVALQKRVVESPEVAEVMHDNMMLREYLGSLYYCQYAQFFYKLAEVESFMRADRYLHEHYQYYVREMRIKAYSQLLESYNSVTMQSMAMSFGISIHFLDQELSRFIAAGRINCKIDRVAEIIETTRPDSKNAQYQAAIKDGDLLLNRIQKLSRVINL